jgi:cold shock CspA family protein
LPHRWIIAEAEVVPEQLRGRIKWFSHQKQYGRIQCGRGLPDIFVQIGDFQDAEGARDLEDGEFVEFGLEQTPAGPVVSNIVSMPSKQ